RGAAERPARKYHRPAGVYAGSRTGGLSMILPTGTTVAVADGETVRLFHNTGVKPGVHLVEITAAQPAPAHSGSGARHHTGSANPDGRRLDEDDFAAAT